MIISVTRIFLLGSILSLTYGRVYGVVCSFFTDLINITRKFLCNGAREMEFMSRGEFSLSPHNLPFYGTVGVSVGVVCCVLGERGCRLSRIKRSKKVKIITYSCEGTQYPIS